MEGVKLRSGKVQVWFSLQLKFSSFELDSEVGRLVMTYFDYLIVFVVSKFLLKSLKSHPILYYLLMYVEQK